MRQVVAVLAFLAMLVPGEVGAVARDWNKNVMATPWGGYVIGNPKAPVKVIEFFSLTCPHCRHFAETGLPPLRTNYIAKGRVSLEIRNFVLNPFDLAASVLMRCPSPQAAVRLFDAAFAEQEKLFGGAQTMSQDAVDRIGSAPKEKRISVISREAGIDRWFIAHGMPAKQVEACLAAPNADQRVANLREKATKEYDIKGTPSFAVNGKMIDGVTWDDLEPAIKAALGDTKMAAGVAH